MLACARIGAIHSVVFGGFAPRELAARIDDARPRVILSASCGIEVNRVVPYKPLLDQAIEMSRHRPERCVILQRPQETGGPPGRTRPRLARGGRPRHVRRVRARRRHRPPLHPLHLGHHRPAQGRGPRLRRATPSRSSGAWRASTASGPARCTGRPRTSAGWSGTPTSSTPRSSRAAPPSSTRASRWARPTPGRSGACAPSTGSMRSSRRRPRSAPSRRRTRRGPTSAATICRASARCSWPESGAIPTRCSGPATASACR